MPRHQLRPIRIDGEVAYVPLTKGYEAIIDADAVSKVHGHNWSASEGKRADGSVTAVYALWSACLAEGKRTILLHRVILDAPQGLDVDHINGNGLDNRRSNLRLATRSQNSCNRKRAISNVSGVKGVSLVDQNSKWRAEIMLKGKTVVIGKFNCRTAAAFAYAKASREVHGEFGRLG